MIEFIEFIADNWYWLLGLICAAYLLEDKLSRQRIEQKHEPGYAEVRERLVADSLLKVEYRDGVPVYSLTPEGILVADRLANQEPTGPEKSGKTPPRLRLIR